MSTVPKTAQTAGPHQQKEKHDNKNQLSRDRLKGVAVLVVFFALIALAMWLASIAPTPEGIEYDYWMMP